MSEPWIDRPVRKEQGVYEWLIVAADGDIWARVTSDVAAQEIVDALNATAPDAGDVEAHKDHRAETYMTLIRRMDEVAAREAALRAERDALAAQTATMREEITDLRNYDRLNSDAAQKVQAAIEAARALTRLYDAGEVTEMDIAPLADALRALDGKDGDAP